jgi:hypothetical protein
MEMLTEQQALEEAPLYVRWSPDRSSYALELKLELVSKICHELAQAERMGVEVGGVLIGVFLNGDTPTLRVDEIEVVRHNPEDGAIYMLAPGQYDRLAQIRQAARSRGKTAVGFFRTHLRPGPLRPSLADRTWLSEEFNQPVYAMLLIHAREPHTAAFFLAAHGQLSTQPSVREFRFNESEFKGLPEILADSRVAGTESSAVRVIRAGSQRWLKVAGILLVTAAALWALSQGIISWLSSPDQIGLAIFSKNGLLGITWNHSAREINHATGAMLAITDGPSRREVRLGPDELKIGSVEYRRETGHVRIAMTVNAPGLPNKIESAEWPPSGSVAK